MPQTLNDWYNKNENAEKELTYVFNIQDGEMAKEEAPKIRTGIWQVFPSACASLTCVPFGLMLGWPSSTYPTLLAEGSPLPISLDQSAMVAGFLMFGVSFGTIFSSKHIGLGPKYGIIMGNVLISLGWILMWQAEDIYWLLSSRFVLGTGHGYAMGQIRHYIQEMTEEALSIILVKQVNIYVLIGFVLAFCVGPFIDFRQYSLISLIISVFILFLAIFLPSTPRELIRAKKFKDAQKLLVFLKPNLNAEHETAKISQKIFHAPESHGFTKIYRNKTLRTKFIKLTLLLLYQQYCGVPATLVYTQILFTESHIPFPELFALFYAVLFFISNIIGIYVSPRYNKKAVLLTSSISITVLIVSKILVINFNINEEYFTYSSVIVMYLFIFSHTIGLGIIPITLINDWFPKSYRSFVTKYFIILFSIFALTITKVFQVLMGTFGLQIPFCLFLGISVLGTIFVSVFIPYENYVVNEDTFNVDVKHIIKEQKK